MQVMPMPDIAVNPRLWQKAQLGSWVSHGIQDADLGLSFPYTLRFQFLDVTRSGVAERTLNERYLWCHFRNRADGAETYWDILKILNTIGTLRQIARPVFIASVCEIGYSDKLAATGFGRTTFWNGSWCPWCDTRFLLRASGSEHGSSSFGGQVLEPREHPLPLPKYHLKSSTNHP